MPRVYRCGFCCIWFRLVLTGVSGFAQSINPVQSLPIQQVDDILRRPGYTLVAIMAAWCHPLFVRDGQTFAGCKRLATRRPSKRQSSALKTLTREAIASRRSGAVFSFDPGVAVTGTGITTVTQVLDDFRQAHLKVAFTGLSMNLKTIFEMLGVTRYVNICETEAEAIASVQN